MKAASSGLYDVYTRRHNPPLPKLCSNISHALEDRRPFSTDAY